MLAKETTTEKRQRRNRHKLKQVAKNRIRLSVARSNKHIYAQLIDDTKGVTLASASTLEKDIQSKTKIGSNINAAEEVGKVISERAKKAKITDVVFDRGANLYHGRVKALADAARNAGLSF